MILLSRIHCSNSSESSDDGHLGLPKRVTARSVNRRPSLARSDTSKNAIEKALSKYDSDNIYEQMHAEILLISLI